MPDKSFELNFATLVDSQMAEKLPSLIPYRVGFQILDKTDDDSRAVGVSACVLNNLWLYIPVCFLDNQIKGMNSIYIKQHDLFIPAMDNWINTLKNEGVHKLGWLRKDERNQGKGKAEDVSLSEANFGEMSKQASGMDIIDRYTINKLKQSGYAIDLSLESYLPTMGKEAANIFAKNMCDSADFANSVFSFLTPREVYAVGELCKQAEAVDTSTSTKRPDVVVIESMNQPEIKNLTDDEKKLFMTQGSFVQDKRKDTSKLFKSTRSSMQFQSPDSNGFYDVLMANGELLPFYVFKIKSVRQDHDVALIPANDATKYIAARARNILAQPSSGKAKEDIGIRAAYAPLVAAGRVDRSPNMFYMYNFLVFDAPDTAIEITNPAMSAGTINGDMPLNTSSCDCHLGATATYSDPDRNRVKVLFTGKEGTVGLFGGTMTVPSTAKLFVNMQESVSDKKYSFGNLSTVESMMYKDAGLRSLRIFAEGNTASVQSSYGDTGQMTKTAALRRLVMTEGIQGGQAQQLLKEAARKGHVDYMIKYAASYDPSLYLNTTGSVEATPMGAATYMNENAGEPSYTQGAGQALLPEEVIAKAQAAANSGNKKVFDVVVLQSLVDAADITELRKSFLTDLIKGMDRDGRLLLMFYWHNDKFKDRYGKEDMDNLEQKLLQAFKVNGDLVLYLKSKMVGNTDSPENLFGTLSQDIGTI